jgi:hypothetical protein
MSFSDCSSMNFRTPTPSKRWIATGRGATHALAVERALGRPVTVACFSFCVDPRPPSSTCLICGRQRKTSRISQVPWPVPSQAGTSHPDRSRHGRRLRLCVPWHGIRSSAGRPGTNRSPLFGGAALSSSGCRELDVAGEAEGLGAVRLAPSSPSPSSSWSWAC